MPPHADIVLATLNAKFIHSAFGLRYLLANLEELQPRATLLEGDITTRPLDFAERVLAKKPSIVGFGVYIWNIAQTTSVVHAIKRIRPDVVVVLGGPEVSYENENLPIVQAADYVICGEGEIAFRILCRQLLAGDRPAGKIITPPVPDFDELRLPYDLYTDADIAHRVIYVEASRGCPFSCEFCLSSRDIPVRQAPLPQFLSALETLLDRGVTQLKFVDRTFNLNIPVSLQILRFLRQRHRPGCLFHFEVVPDRLPPELLNEIAQFPPGALQLEAGVQTFNPEVAGRISRRQNYERLEENLTFLRNHTGAHIHADLIAGLPGESPESFASGFDRLLALRPHEIQVGILKRLRGTPIARHNDEWQMVYSPDAPYEILQNKLLTFDDTQRLRRFARHWDLVFNSGNFVETAPLIWSAPGQNAQSPAPSPFQAFQAWSTWLHRQIGRTDSIALLRLMHLLHTYLVQSGHDAQQVAERLWRDYQRGGRREKPEFLRGYALSEPISARTAAPGLPKRQRRHGKTAPLAPPAPE